jgi:hypothetical protein
LPESTFNLLFGALMGILGGLITIPINAVFLRVLKEDEQYLQHRLDLVAKKRELLWQHHLELERTANKNDIIQLRSEISELRNDVENLKRRFR